MLHKIKSEQASGVLCDEFAKVEKNPFKECDPTVLTFKKVVGEARMQREELFLLQERLDSWR